MRWFIYLLFALASQLRELLFRIYLDEQFVSVKYYVRSRLLI